ncbi:MAG: HdeD family acid-resistance protein [Eubacteriaceae bacterium]
MNKKIGQRIIGISAGLGVVLIGVYVILQRQTSIQKMVAFFSGALIIFAIANLMSLILKNRGKSKKIKVLGAVINMVFAFVLFFFRFSIAEWIPLIFSSYLFIISIVKFITGFTYWRDGVPNFGVYIIEGMASFAFSIYLFFNSYFNMVSFAVLAGGYFIWYGITLIFDALNEEETQETMSKTAKKFQRKARIAIPSVVGALLPMRLLKNYDNKIASEDANDFIKSQQVMVLEKAGIKPFNVEILVHLSNKLMESFGHVDLILGDTVVSYGNFDHHSYRLGGVLSDGVIFTCEREAYLRQSIVHDGKVLISFKVNFTSEELKVIRLNYDQFQENMYEWFTDTQLAERGLIPIEDYTGVEDTIYKGTHAQFFKFKKGPLKTYFAFNTNCVKVADSLFENTGFDKPATGNIVTPGAYYQFLMGELERSGTKVYEKNIYSKETFECREERP